MHTHRHSSHLMIKRSPNHRGYLLRVSRGAIQHFQVRQNNGRTGCWRVTWPSLLPAHKRGMIEPRLTRTMGIMPNLSGVSGVTHGGPFDPATRAAPEKHGGGMRHNNRATFGRYGSVAGQGLPMLDARKYGPHYGSQYGGGRSKRRGHLMSLMKSLRF
jgi:hypothetical protein